MRILPLALSAAACAVASLYAAPGQATADRVHRDIDRRFVVRPQGLVLDYVNADGSVDLPEGDEPAKGKPNALAWWTPLENGPFLSGLYLDGVLDRWRITRSSDDARLARELAGGLVACASLDARTPGFIARGFYGPERSFYPIGSDDQTAPWLYGLWRYLQSGLASPRERAIIEAKILEVANALKSHGWKMPCATTEDLSAGQYRGEWIWADYRGASRRLFASRVAYEISRDDRWLADYRAALDEKVDSRRTRIDCVEAGMADEWSRHPALGVNHLWIYVVSQAMVSELHRLETDPAVKTRYRTSLQGNAELCAGFVKDSVPGELTKTPFLTDWRTMNASWRPQHSTQEAVALALDQLKAWNNRGRDLETVAVREPFCAAWIVFFAPEATEKIAVAAARFGRLFDAVPWADLRSSSGVFAVPAWYRLNAPDGLAGRLPEVSAATEAPSVPVTRSRIEGKTQRCADRFPFVEMPPEFTGRTLVTVARGSNQQPGAGYSVKAERDGRVWLLVMPKGPSAPPAGWSAVDLKVRWSAGSNVFIDRVYVRDVSAGETITVPAADFQDKDGTYPVPHALVMEEAP